MNRREESAAMGRRQGRSGAFAAFAAFAVACVMSGVALLAAAVDARAQNNNYQGAANSVDRFNDFFSVIEAARSFNNGAGAPLDISDTSDGAPGDVWLRLVLGEEVEVGGGGTPLMVDPSFYLARISVEDLETARGLGQLTLTNIPVGEAVGGYLYFHGLDLEGGADLAARLMGNTAQAQHERLYASPESGNARLNFRGLIDDDVYDTLTGTPSIPVPATSTLYDTTPEGELVYREAADNPLLFTNIFGDYEEFILPSLPRQIIMRLAGGRLAGNRIEGVRDLIADLEDDLVPIATRHRSCVPLSGIPVSERPVRSEEDRDLLRAFCTDGVDDAFDPDEADGQTYAERLGAVLTEMRAADTAYDEFVAPAEQVETIEVRMSHARGVYEELLERQVGGYDFLREEDDGSLIADYSGARRAAHWLFGGDGAGDVADDGSDGRGLQGELYRLAFGNEDGAGCAREAARLEAGTGDFCLYRNVSEQRMTALDFKVRIERLDTELRGGLNEDGSRRSAEGLVERSNVLRRSADAVVDHLTDLTPEELAAVPGTIEELGNLVSAAEAVTNNFSESMADNKAGVAIATAMGNVHLEPSRRFALDVNSGYYAGNTGVSVQVGFRLTRHVFASGGAAFAERSRKTMARIALSTEW